MNRARELCCNHLATLVRRYPDLPPGGLSRESLNAAGLDARDAALAISIEQSVVRSWTALVTVAQTQLTRPWDRLEPGLQAAILCGAAQLLLLDRVPDHAAINESVQWSKQHVRPKAAGLVNAVLRRIADLRDSTADTFDTASRRQIPLSDGRATVLRKDVFDADAIRRLAQQTSHPLPLLNAWRQQHDDATCTALALHSLVQPPIIITGHAGEASIDPAVLTPHDIDGYFVFTGDRAALDALLAAHPDARVQDPGSAEPVQLTRTLQPSVIIDYCAGRGTKTRQLAALHPNARIIATDVNAERLDVLRRSAAGKGVEVVAMDQIRNWSGLASLLVLDVPCSNTGVLARRVEAKHRVCAQSTAQLVALQRQIVADALPLLSDDGHLLYCTCSINPAENEQQIDWLIKWHNFNVSDQCSSLPAGQPGGPFSGYRDGGFGMLLSR